MRATRDFFKSSAGKMSRLVHPADRNESPGPSSTTITTTTTETGPGTKTTIITTTTKGSGCGTITKTKTSTSAYSYVTQFVRKPSVSGSSVILSDDHNNLSAVTHEVVLREIELRLVRLNKTTEYDGKPASADFRYLMAANQLHEKYSVKRTEICDKMTKCGVVELFNKIYGTNFKDMKKQSLRYILDIVWNGTDVNVNMCEKVLQTKTHEQILKLLASDMLRREVEVNDIIFVGLVSIINNIVRQVDGALSSLGAAGAVEILKPYLHSSDMMIRSITEIGLAYIMPEKQYDDMNDTDITFLVDTLGDAVSSTSRQVKGYSAYDMVKGLNKIAVSDANKRMIIQSGAMDHYVKLMQPTCTTEENYQAAKGIWNMSFKCADEIRKVDGCVDAIKALTHHSDPEVQKQARGALWVLEEQDQKPASPPKEPAETSEATSDIPHVFISYQWKSQKTLLKVRDRLKESGYHIWMDVDSMTGSILEAMALAVEKAAVVIICMSQKYKESPNCRTESEYAYRKHKDIVPLLLQNKYECDGWLGAIAGNKLYFDFSTDHLFEESIIGLIKELGNRGLTDGNDKPLASSKVSQVEATQPLCEWSSEKAIEWLKGTVLSDSINRFRDIDGSVLVEFRHLHGHAPESYYKTLKNDFNLTLVQILQFTKELKEIQ